MPIHYEIRTAEPADADAVDALLKASYPVLMASSYDAAVLSPALRLMTKSNPSLLNSRTYYVAEIPGGELAGCGGWTRERPGTGKTEPGVGHIRHFATHPAWTRRGIGRALYRHGEDVARASGIETFECYSSLNAERFYASLGFARVREMDLVMGSGVIFRAVLMHRSL